MNPTSRFAAIGIAALSVFPAALHASVATGPGVLAPGVAQASPNNPVYAILKLADGSMLVGGDFTSITVGGSVKNRGSIARFLADGTLDPGFTPSFDGTVRALAQDSAGRIFVGGNFTSVTFGSTTTPRIRVARLTSSLALDTAFDTSFAGPNAQINALAPTGNGGVYVGGAFGFNLVGNTTVNRVARLSPIGALDTGFFAPTIPVNNEVKALLRRADGKLYVGGTFGTTLLSSSGVRDTAFTPAAPSILGVQGQAMLTLPDGSLVLAANGGLPQPYLRRLDPDTGASLGEYATGHLGSIFSIALQADGKLLSGSIGPFKRTNLTTGTDDTGFAAFDSSVLAIAVDGAGRIWAGGSFMVYDGVLAGRMVILKGGSSNNLAPQAITFPALSDKNTGDAPFNLTATSNSGLPVSYSISGPATLSGSTVTLTGAAGVVTVTATQTGNATTAAATPVVRTFTVIDLLNNYLADAGVPANLRGPHDDADSDGLDNLLEYALDLNPNGNGGSFSGSLPITSATDTKLKFTYRRVRNDVTYTVETSSDLTGGSWTSVGVTQGSPAPDGNTSASIPLGSGSQFLRLKVRR